VKDEHAVIDSGSVGDSTRFRTLAELERGLEALGRARAERGRVVRVVRRGEAGRRESLERARLSPEAGVEGDASGRRASPSAEMQVAVMEAAVAELIANGQPLPLFGDNLFLDLDLSESNLSAGSRVRAGGALLEVTPMPHNGCRKFQARFGPDALRCVASQALRQRRLRGLYLRVVTAGELGRGDPVEVVERATPA